jgi:hypothetical protein
MDNDFDFPEVPPSSSSPPFELFDMDSPRHHLLHPSLLSNHQKRIRKPTAKRRMALEDALHEGPGLIQVDTRPEPEPPQVVSLVQNILLEYNSQDSRIFTYSADYTP